MELNYFIIYSSEHLTRKKYRYFGIRKSELQNIRWRRKKKELSKKLENMVKVINSWQVSNQVIQYTSLTGLLRPL